MSAPFTDLVITSQGQAMTASAWASSGVITITSVQFGSGFPGVSDNIPGYTALKAPVCNGQITGQNIIVPGQCTIRSNLAGTAIPSTFQINEIGVFASFSGGGSQLVAYMSTGAATGDTLTLNSPVVKDYAILVTFAQGVITTVNISLLQTVGLHAVSHLDNGIDPIPPPSTARSGLLLASPNDATKVLIGTNPPSWSGGWLPGMRIGYGGAAAPAGWLLEDGTGYSTATYAALFAVIGYTFGGSGATFNVPDSRGKVDVGSGTGTGLTARVRGATGGQETHVLTVAELASHGHGVSDPTHAHAVYDPTHAHAIADPTHDHSNVSIVAAVINFAAFGNQEGVGTLFTGPAQGFTANVSLPTGYSATGIGIYGAATGIGIYGAATGISIVANGSNNGHNNMQPFLVTTKIIKT